MRQIFALRFEFSPLSYVVVWPDRPAGRSRTIDQKGSWLDVRAGDEIFYAGKRQTVTGVRIFRAYGAVIGRDACGPVITCGREWLLERAG